MPKKHVLSVPEESTWGCVIHFLLAGKRDGDLVRPTAEIRRRQSGGKGIISTRRIGRWAGVLLLTLALFPTSHTTARAQTNQQSATALIGRHPSQLTRHPEALAALQQALGARLSAEEDLIWSVGSGMTLIAQRYLVGVSMAPSSGGDPSILIAYDIVARAAYVVRYGTIGSPGRTSRFEVFSPSSQAIWPASLERYIANWRPEALAFISLADDATAALAAGPPPEPVAPPPRRWLVGFGQGTLVLSIGNDEGAFFSFDCRIGHEDTLPGISLEVRSSRKAPIGRLLRVIILVDGVDRSGGLRLEAWRPESGGKVGLGRTMSGKAAIERTRNLVAAAQTGSTLEIRVPYLNAVERFSLVDASAVLDGDVDKCLTTAEPSASSGGR